MQTLYKNIFSTIFLFPSLVFSAGQGTLGTTSTGTVNVSITIPALVQITGLSDITLGSTSTFPATGNTTACIYSNLSSGDYFVTATSGNGSGGNFIVKDSGTDVIVYSAFWSTTSAATQSIPLTSATKTAQLSGGSTSSLTCSGTPNANFNISFSSAEVQGAPAATYTDVVTILITPT